MNPSPRPLLAPLHRGLAAAALIAAAAAGNHAAPSATGSTRASRDRPNVLILFTDDQRFDTIGALGNREISTPNMDRLVERGVSFQNTYIMGSPHGAVCMPSRAMLLTGRHYFNLPLSVTVTWSVPSDERGRCDFTTFPEVFRAAGYETFVTGKWHNGRSLLARGFTAGDAIFFGGMSDHLAVPVHDFDPTGRYDAKPTKPDTFSSELFSTAAVDFLHERQDEQPFLMYVSYTAPHDPRMAPQEYVDLYQAEETLLPPNYLDEHPFPQADHHVRDEKLAPFPRTPTIAREHIAAYYAMISHTDAQIGRILDALEETGAAENTIIVFAGDNGLAVGQHGLLGKQSLNDHSARVPLVICGPGLPKGEVRTGLTYLHDVFPTLTALAGLETPDTVQTQSLVPMLQAAEAAVRDSVLLSYSKAHSNCTRYSRAVRCGDLKLIEWQYDDVTTTQLFDLADDPWEMRNLADDASHADARAELEALLSNWRRRVGDFLLKEEP
ncbi:MAG: sulfatase-like hydrolase/transferase [Phycisphaerales bacterium JB038]